MKEITGKEVVARNNLFVVAVLSGSSTLIIVILMLSSLTPLQGTNKRPLENLSQLSRRALIRTSWGASVVLLTSTAARSRPTNHDQLGRLSSSPTSSADFRRADFLRRRVESLDVADALSYTPGVRQKDIYYPQWFEGRWEACSVFAGLSAPLGDDLFGGKIALEAANADLNSTLCYATRFKSIPLPKQANDGEIEKVVIGDRLYNVEAIALASMGKDSIIDDSQGESDLARRLSLVVSPAASSNETVFKIMLAVTDRDQTDWRTSIDTFDALERTTQTIAVRSLRTSNAFPPPPLRKVIETITCYELKGDSKTIVAHQRTATYLSPDDPRYPVAQALDRRVMNTAVDVRKYTVTYKKKS